ncbi:hypothetical protein F5Y09DRAFT_321117 [Xylaria sp. FL1042]|nr:hypothetical protein F5Y09DRAFT_321117 [Xylaria sp. FL1042]
MRALFDLFCLCGALDPRIYDIIHWYESCGDNIGSRCSHNPMTRSEEEFERQKLVREEEPEWGQSWEMDRLRGITGESFYPPRLPAPRPQKSTRAVSPIPLLYSTHASRSYSPVQTSGRNSQNNSKQAFLIIKSLFVARLVIPGLFTLLQVIILTLCVALLHNEQEGIGWGARNYSVFVSTVGFLTSSLGLVSYFLRGPYFEKDKRLLRGFQVIALSYLIFGFIAGIVLATSINSCWHLSRVPSLRISPSVCMETTALGIFTLLSLPAAVLFSYYCSHRYRRANHNP